MYTCAEITRSEIAHLQLEVDAKKIKTFCTIKRIFKQCSSTIPPISTKRTIISYLKSLNLSKTNVLQLFPHFKYIKYLSGPIVCWKRKYSNTGRNIFLN